MKQVQQKIAIAQNLFLKSIETAGESGGLTKERYVRFLSMQYHLTMGVQRHFMAIAGHSATAKKRGLRKWLVQFAQEEEFHFEVALADLRNLGAEPLACPLDVKLWWLFFDDMVVTRPFVRLGATCILENISGTSDDLLDQMIKQSPFLNEKNLRFLTIHRHGPNLAHGDQIAAALTEARLSDEEMSDVLYGAEIGTTMYMRFMKWILSGSPAT